MASDRRRLAVLGSPIAHSKSPALHRAAYDLLGLDWEYTAIELDGAGLRSFLDTRQDPQSRLVFIVDDDDPTRSEYPGIVHVVPATGSMGGALRAAVADRLRPSSPTCRACDVRSPGWVVRALGRPPSIATGPLARRRSGRCADRQTTSPSCSARRSLPDGPA